MLQVRLALIFLTVWLSHVRATASHCSSDSIKSIAQDACDHLMEHISKRQTDLSDYGYNVTTGE